MKTSWEICAHLVCVKQRCSHKAEQHSVSIQSQTLASLLPQRSTDDSNVMEAQAAT